MERLFGEKRKLILPIILDIANVVKNASIEQQQQQQEQTKRQHHHKKHQSRQHHQQQQQQNGKRKYEIMKKRHRRSIEYNENGSKNTHNNDMAMVIKAFQRNLKSTKNNRQRKSTNYFTFYRDMFNRSNMTTDIRKTDDIEMAADDDTADNTHFDDDNFVHVTLPLLTNRTISLEEYEDLALGELNGTDFYDEYQPDEKLNETLPEPAMLLSNRYHIPINRHPVYLNTRKCELFGNLCLRVEDYPM